jgi:cytochrome c551/c552
MVFGLSTSHEIGLAVSGAIFITFALLSSFVFPRFDPNFPGRKGLRWYIPLCFVFFIGMLGAVLYFGQEEKTGEAAAAPGTTVTAPSGNATAGKAVFTSAGCAACHTFTPAGTTATVGPDLDKLADYAKQAGEPIEDFAHGAIINPPPQYVPPGYANTMPTTFGQSLTPQQIDDVVAFLTSGG